MVRIMVAGIGTDVGKTVVSAILTMLLNGEYWKPIECGTSDSLTVQGWIRNKVHTPAYHFEHPLSPHHAAELDGTCILEDKITVPKTTASLIIEGVGGVLTPLSYTKSVIDLFKTWECKWVVVSRHYLGSINHTLLTLECLKHHKISVAGLIFNGEPNPATEEVILNISKVPFLGRLLPEKELNQNTLNKYVEQWRFQDFL